MHWRGAAVLAALTLALVPVAHAQDVGGLIGEGAAEQSCKLLEGGTAGAPDQVPSEPDTTLPATWPESAAPQLPGQILFRTPTESFNRLYEFATRGGTIYTRARGGGPWRELPVPACFAGRVASISVDDDELIALDTSRRIFTMDNALKSPLLWNWTSRWGTPFWTGL